MYEVNMIMAYVNEALHRGRPPPANRGDANAAAMLRGVERGDWRARPEAALKLGRKLAGRGEVAYWAVLPEGRPPESKCADDHALVRGRTRVGAAKLVE